MTQQIREFAIGDATATVGIRSSGSMWVSVLGKRGAHYQCDFVGSFDRGPIRKEDFMYGPPSWVKARLSTASREPLI